MVGLDNRAMASYPSYYSSSDDYSTGDQQSFVSALTLDLESHYPSPKNNRDLLPSYALFGRQKELEVLEGCLERVCTCAATELVMIYGRAGSGKTTLCESLRPLALERGAQFSVGKFDQFQWSNVPYAAISTCLTDLIDSLDGNSDRRVAVRSAMGDNVFLLTPLLRNLEQLAGLCGFEAKVVSNKDIMEHAFLRVQSSISSLLKSLATKHHPIVLLFDDVQWADPASLAILKSILADATLQHVLVLVTCRDEDDVSVLSPSSPSSSDTATSSVRVTDLHLKDLSMDDAYFCTASILQEDSPSIAQLSEICFSKTNGNPYFLQQFLSLLQKKEYLRQHPQPENGIRQWIWDEALVQETAILSGNVLDVMQEHLTLLHPIVSHMLQIAVCLGRNFRVDILEILMDATKGNKPPSHAIHEILQVAASLGHSFQRMTTELIYGAVEQHHSLGTIDEDASDDLSASLDCFSVPNLPSIQVAVCLANSAKVGLLLKDGEDRFQFSHDRVQQAICESLGTSKLDKHLAIGRILRQHEQFNPGNPSFFFLVVDQLNAGCHRMDSDEDLVSLVSLNVEAAVIAAEQSGYMSAQRYLRQALTLIQPHSIMWDEEYELMLECCTLAAEMELACGNYKQANSYVDQVFARAETSHDRLPASFTKISSLICLKDLPGARALAVDSLSKIGHKFPMKPKKALVTSELNRTTNMLAHVPDDQLVSIFPMAVAAHMTENKLLRLLCWTAFLMADGETLAVAAFRMVQLTILNGFSDAAPLAFAMCGLIHSQAQHHVQACRMGALAMRGLERVTDTHMKAQTNLILWSFVLHWSTPMLALNDAGASWGKQSGDSDLAFNCFLHKCLASFVQGGMPLGQLKRYIQSLCDEMVHYGYTDDAFYRMILQASTNLSRNANILFPWKLTGEVMAEEIMLQQAAETNNSLVHYALWNVKLQLCAYFNQWDLAVQAVENIGDNHKCLQPHFTHLYYVMFAALTYAVQYNQTKKRKYRRAMMKGIAQLKTLSDAGVELCEPMFALLLAEESAANGAKNPHATLQAYEYAARAFSTQHQRQQQAFALNYQALCHERAARSFITNGEVCREQLSKARLFYQAWGANRKVALLDQEMAAKNWPTPGVPTAAGGGGGGSCTSSTAYTVKSQEEMAGMKTR